MAKGGGGAVRTRNPMMNPMMEDNDSVREAEISQIGGDQKVVGVRLGSLTPTHRFLFVQGVLYFLAGMGLFVVPHLSCYIFTAGFLNYYEPEFDAGSSDGALFATTDPREILVVRAGGGCLSVIGYLYCQGARENTLLVLAAGLFNRLITVPLAVIALWLFFGAKAHDSLGICIAFGVMDPLLALLTHLSMRGTLLLPRYFSRRADDDDPVPFHVAAGAHARPQSGVGSPSVGYMLKLALGLYAIDVWADAWWPFVGVGGALTRAPPGRRIASLQGVVYMMLGLALLLVPDFLIQLVFRDTVSLSQREENITRLFLGLPVVSIGFLHVQATRSACSLSVTSLCISSLVVQPFFLFMLFLLGVQWQICIAAVLGAALFTLAERAATITAGKQLENTNGTEQTDLLPTLVLVPGLKGCCLQHKTTGALRYPTVGQVLRPPSQDQFPLPEKRDAQGQQLKDDLIPDGPVTSLKVAGVSIADFYRPFLNEFSSCRNVRVFDYDWRRELAETGDQLEKFLESLYVENDRKCGAQVVCHSMGGLIAFPVLNRRPELFHSVLFAAAALGGGNEASGAVSFLRDLSMPGYANTMGRNKTMCTPGNWVGWTSGCHFLPLVEAADPEDLPLKEKSGSSISFNYHEIEDWERLMLGPFHPESSVDMTSERRAFFRETLKKCKEYRKLMVPNTDIEYPPITVLRSSKVPTATEYRRRESSEPFDFVPSKTTEGDGRITLSQAKPPDGVPVLATYTNSESHGTILSDTVNVHKLLNAMLNPVIHAQLPQPRATRPFAIMLPTLVLSSLCVVLILHNVIVPPWTHSSPLLDVAHDFLEKADATNITDTTPAPISNERTVSAPVSAAQCSRDILFDCVDAGPFYQHLQWGDSHLLQQLMIAVASMVCNFGVLHYHWTVPPHPKFVMRWPRYISIRMHLISGTIEILAGWTIWFCPEALLSCQVLGTTQAVASFVHIGTAFYQTPIVFGTHLFMIPAYFFVCIVKLYMAVRLLLGPCCMYTSVVLFNIHAIYAWCRIFIKLFLYLNVVKENEYTVSIMFAGFICLPGVGAGTNLLAGVFIIVYISAARLLLPREAFVRQSLENHRNMFDNSLFTQGAECPFSSLSMEKPPNHGTQDGRGVSVRYSKKDQIAMLKQVFKKLDTDGNGYLTYDELQQAGAKFANSALVNISKSLLKMGHGVKFDFNNLRDIVMNNLTDFDLFKAEAEAAQTPRDECQVIFRAIDVHGTGSLEPVELRILFQNYGLPDSELDMVMKRWDDGDGKIDFDEFFNNFGPLWKFAYHEMDFSFKRIAAERERTTL